jgi:hypothetical protein
LQPTWRRLRRWNGDWRERRPSEPLAATPATGKDPLLTVREPEAIIQTIGDWAAKNEITRSEAVRRLVEFGLKAKGK